MKVLCTRPYCSNPLNNFPELDNSSHLKTTQQKYCTSCGMHLILAGRYLPLKLLGKGGFGTAFLAIDRYSPTLRKCVVKQFQPEGNLGDQELQLAQQLFEREALVLENLGNRHKQIPNLFAFFPLLISSRRHKNEEEQYFYLVQEFIDGQDLQTELIQQGLFSETKVTEVLIEVLSILKFVHHHHSIHRDIKPSNIMRNEQGILYLLDFGAVKQVTTGGGNSQIRSTGIYSMGFAPPEQMTGGQVYPSTDLYALAVTCLNLLTGKESTELYDSYNHQWQWRQFAPHLSDRLGKILDKMLLASPSARFQSAEEVLAALSTSASSSSPAIKQTSTSIQTPSSPPSSPLPTPPPVAKQSLPPQAKIRRPSQPLPLFPILSGAAFIGLEAVLSAIVVGSTLLPIWGFNLAIGIWSGIIGLIILMVVRRTIEKIDLIIFGAISLAIVWYLPILHSLIVTTYQLQRILVVILPLVAAIGMMTIVSLFLLVYKFIAGIFNK